MPLTFEQLTRNVQEWSAARGIYEHSSARAQLLKAFSEMGELADAEIKDRKGRMAPGGAFVKDES